MRQYLLLFVFLIYSLVLGDKIYAQDHLLLTEAVLSPTSDEYLEIYNPTSAPIDLTNYYLSDDEDYALYAGTFGNGPAPNIISSDFIVQFPPGEIINPGQVIVIAFDGAEFDTTFGFKADYEISGTDPSTPDMLQSDVGSTAGLTNTGENACLFYWDGLTDLVIDVDMVNLGTPTSTNDIADKTGLAVDGPDGDTLSTTYLADAFTMPMQLADPGTGFSTKRVILEGANEVNSGGNGITGHDETTENILITWDTIYAAPDPGVVGPGVPVELVSFNADVNENDVTLSWITATELNNSGFEVQRSGESEVWEKIGFISGNGTTTEIHNYSFNDNNLEDGSYAYRLKQVNLDGTFEFSKVIFVEVVIPLEFELEQNYPNPFNPSTTIKFSIPEGNEVSLKIYNSLGQEIRTLVNRFMEAGVHTVNFDAVKLNSGMYFYRLEAGKFSQVRKMTLIK